MRVDEVLGYLKAHLERGHQSARVAIWQALQLVQPPIEDAQAFSKCNIHLLLAPPKRPVPPGVGERLWGPVRGRRRRGSRRGRG